MNSSDSSWTYISVGIYILSGLHIMTITNAYTKGDACFDEPFTVRCEAVKRVNGIKDLECKGTLLPNGIKVLNISRGTLTLQGSAKNSTNHQTQFKCQVQYSDNSANTDVQKINFTDFSVCIRTERAANVNLTSVLKSLFPWKQVIDIELYANRSKFAYCNSMICKLTKIDSNHPSFLEPITSYTQQLAAAN
ncbi:hypothetical protein OS493_011677 [Desmophyllum pertusum]|uniref:Uncharacterized protein n=1 Tax=Desmophyllum pertusum TaxID=174260 RepID=A0A9W9YDZ7_9CNID|nr:hypothetical protein OS493_011677 [Desmophyllum pertusum]